MPRGLVHVAGSERRVLSHPGCPPSQTILEIHIQRGGISIQGPAVWATPGSLHFYAMHGCGSLPSATDGNPHTQLPRRLAHSGPVAGGLTSHKTRLLSHLVCLGLRVNFAKSILSPSQWVSLLGTVIDSADDSNCLSGVSRDNSVPRGLLQGRYRQSAKRFPELGLMVAASLVLQLGLLHMRPIQFWLKQRGPSAAWRHGCHCVTVTLDCVSALAHWRGPLLAKARRGPRHRTHRRKVVTTDAFNKGWGALCEGKPTFGLWSEEESGLHLNCLEMLAVCQACQFFLPGHSETPCVNTLRQQVRGVIHKSPGRPRLEATLHAGERPSCVGSEQSALTEGDACARQNEPRSRHVVKEQLAELK